MEMTKGIYVCGGIAIIWNQKTTTRTFSESIMGH